MKLIFPVGLLLACISVYAIFKNDNATIKKSIAGTDLHFTENENTRLKNYAAAAKLFIASKAYEHSYCFLIDMKQPSGKKRFFVYSLSGDSVINAGLVTHGSGSQTYTDALKFSNSLNSNATSLGKYKIGNEYQGKFGLAFKLYGLDKTNSNAFERFVVLHAHPLVPATEIFPQQLCVSWGCPTVAPVFLKELKRYIDNSERPVLLYIFY